MNRITMRLLLAAGALLFLSVIPAFANEADVLEATRNYTTYGGTAHIIADSFQRLALIMLHPQFQNGYYVAMLLAFLIGGAMTAIKQLGTLNAGFGPWLSWFGSIIMGMLVAGTFFMPTTSMNIWDATTNELHVVPSVPHGIVITAGLFNNIETGFINFVDVVGLDGMTYASAAGGIGLSAVANVFSGFPDSTTYPVTISSTLTKYLEDCVFFEMHRPGTLLTANSFYSPANNDLTQALALANNPAVLTMYYGSDTAGNLHGSGLSVTCQVAWSGGASSSGVNIPGLANELSNMTALNFWNHQCAATGFNINNSFAMNRCRSLVHSTLDRMLDGVGTLPGNSSNAAGDLNIVRNITIARSISAAIESADPGTQMRLSSNLKLTSTGVGTGIMANDYIPLLKAIVLSMFLGIFPFLCFLLPTPLFGRVLSLLLGSFCFMCMWSVCDAVVNALALDRATDVFQQIQGEGLGLANMYLLPSMSMKALSVFGFMRFMAVIFAGVITSQLIKFGGYFMASFAGRVGSNVSAAGSAAGESTIDSVKQSSKYSSYTDAPSDIQSKITTVENSGGNFNYDAKRTNERVLGARTNLETASTISNNFYGTENAAGTLSQSNAFDKVFHAGENREMISTAGKLGKAWTSMGEISGAWKGGDLAAKHLAAADLGRSNFEAAYAANYPKHLEAIAKGDTAIGIEADKPGYIEAAARKDALTKGASLGQQLITRGFGTGDEWALKEGLGYFQSIASQPGGMAVLQAETAKFNASNIGIANDDQAYFMQQALKNYGDMDVPLKDLKGHKVSLAMGVNEDGSVRILNANSSSGWRATNDATSINSSGKIETTGDSHTVRDPIGASPSELVLLGIAGNMPSEYLREENIPMLSSKLASGLSTFVSMKHADTTNESIGGDAVVGVGAMPGGTGAALKGGYRVDSTVASQKTSNDIAYRFQEILKKTVGNEAEQQKAIQTEVLGILNQKGEYAPDKTPLGGLAKTRTGETFNNLMQKTAKYLRGDKK